MAPRWYRALLRLLPESFRDEYGSEMCQVAEEQWRAVCEQLGPWGAVRFWWLQGWAVARAAVTVRWGGGRRARTGRVRPGDDDGRMTMEGLWMDLRHSTRALAKRPLFALMTAGTLALGIGASTTLFSAVYSVLVRPLPYDQPDRIVAVFHENRETGERGQGLSAANARDLSESAERLSSVAVADPWSLDLEVDGRAESLRGWAVSEGFFEALGIEAVLGRTFLPEEYEQGGSPAVLLGHGAWSGRFGADPGVVGRPISLDGGPVTVVGILPADFDLPTEAEIWTPRPWGDYDDPSRASDYMTGFARLAPGASLTAARAEVERLGHTLSETHPRTMRETGFRLVPLREHLFGDVRTPLLVLFGAVGLVLLIACANVAGLVLARGYEREHEYALRGALGASRGRLLRYLATESVLLAGMGCLLGIGLTYAGVHAIAALGPDHLPRIDEISVDGTVLAFAVAAAAVSALLGGLVPSFRLSRPDLRGMLAQGSRGGPGGGRPFVLRDRLVVVEVAATVVLLVGAGLLGRSFATLLDQELGFDPTDRLAVQVFAYDYETAADRAAFVNTAVERMEALPGVEAVALASSIPGATDGTLAAIDISLPFVVEGRDPPPEGQEPRAWSNQVSDGFFEVLEIPLLRGRGILRSDGPDAPPVVLVNETFARRHFPDEDPVGERIVLGSGDRARTWEIVGLVADVRAQGHARPPRPEIYRSLGQSGTGSLTFILETRGDAAAVTAPALEAIWEANPSQSVWGAATVESLVADWLNERRFNLLLLGGFAAVALVLSLVGIYGLVSYSVERRVAELGIRKALGGRPSRIVGMVLREGATLAGTGVLLGLVAAVALSRFLEGMLFGVEPTDPATFALLSLGVLVVASLAALVPAVRAARLDPMAALRGE